MRPTPPAPLHSSVNIRITQPTTQVEPFSPEKFLKVINIFGGLYQMCTEYWWHDVWVQTMIHLCKAQEAVFSKWHWRLSVYSGTHTKWMVPFYNVVCMSLSRLSQHPRPEKQVFKTQSVLLSTWLVRLLPTAIFIFVCYQQDNYFVRGRQEQKAVSKNVCIIFFFVINCFCDICILTHLC